MRGPVMLGLLAAAVAVFVITVVSVAGSGGTNPGAGGANRVSQSICDTC